MPVSSRLKLTHFAFAHVLLIAFLAEAFAVTTGQCPVKKAKSVVKCKHVIVGGGSAGLYAAYLLRNESVDVCLVEANDYFGGRIHDTPSPDVPAHAYGECALRYLETMTDVRCLMHQLNVSAESSDYDTILYTRGKWGTGMNDFAPGGQFENSFRGLGAKVLEDLETAFYEYLFLGTRPANPLTGVQGRPISDCSNYTRVLDYVRDKVGQEAAALLLAGSSFRADFVASIDVCGYIEYFQADWERGGRVFYPVGGWGAVMVALHNAGAQRGVRYFAGQPINCISRNSKGQYTVTSVNGTAFTGSSMVVAAPPYNLMASQVGGNVGAALLADPHMKAPAPVHVVSITAFWPERWWAPLMSGDPYKTFRVVTDASCMNRMEFQGTDYYRQSNGSRIVYVDDPTCADMWLKTYEKGGNALVQEVVMRELAGIFPNLTIPAPTQLTFNNKPYAWHNLESFSTRFNNITNAAMKEWAAQPLAGQPLCLVGDAYNPIGSGWVQAGMQGVVSCLRRNFAGVLPSSDLDFAEDCGLTTFSNEVDPPTATSKR